MRASSCDHHFVLGGWLVEHSTNTVRKIRPACASRVTVIPMDVSMPTVLANVFCVGVVGKFWSLGNYRVLRGALLKRFNK